MRFGVVRMISKSRAVDKVVGAVAAAGAEDGADVVAPEHGVEFFRGVSVVPAK